MKVDVKLMNRKSVYDYIRSKPEQEASRPEIARALHITEPTVLKITNFFLERGILVGRGTVENLAAGRRADRLVFNPDVAYTVQVEYDGNQFKMAVLNMNCQIVHIIAKHIALPLTEIMERVIPEEYAKLDLFGKEVLAMGVALPAAVDTINNRITMRNPVIDLNGREDFSEQVQRLSEALQLSVYLENDVNAAALFEYHNGRKSGQSDLIYIMLGLGIGAGLILDGKLRRGKHYCTGEIGFFASEPNFVLERDRPGQFESSLCREYLLEKFGIDILVGTETGNLEGMIRHIASQTALCIADFSAMLDVDDYVLDGYLPALLGDRLIHSIQQQCDRMCLNPVHVRVSSSKESVLRGLGVIVSDAAVMRFLSGEQSSQESV